MSPVRGCKESGVEVEKAASVLSPLIKRLGLTAGVRLVRIRGDWDSLFGPTLSIHMSPSRLAEGELLVNVDQPIWMQQLTFHKRQIVEKLRPYGVRDIRFRLGKVYRPTIPSTVARQSAGLSTEDAAFVEALVSGVSDEVLKEAIRSAAEKSMGSSAHTVQNEMQEH